MPSDPGQAAPDDLCGLSLAGSRLVSANPASRYTRPLTELVSLAFGPQFVIGEEFAALGAAAVAIFGSWAARYEGITGPPPNDVDVLVIGDAPRSDMYEAAAGKQPRRAGTNDAAGSPFGSPNTDQRALPIRSHGLPGERTSTERCARYE